jgi:hypothetical protein
MLPLVLGLLYAPSFATLVSSDLYGEAAYWPLWAMPWVIILTGYVYLRYWGTSTSLLNDARLQRAERYARALKPIGKEASYEFCRRLTFMTLIASLLFALCLPIILMDFTGSRSNSSAWSTDFCSSCISCASPSRKTSAPPAQTERKLPL